MFNGNYNDRSLNGIISIDDGNGCIIENGTITCDNININNDLTVVDLTANSITCGAINSNGIITTTQDLFSGSHIVNGNVFSTSIQTTYVICQYIIGTGDIVNSPYSLFTGNITCNNITSSGDVVLSGTNHIYQNDANNNTFYGNCFQNNVSGVKNVALGYMSLNGNINPVSGGYNVAIGNRALYKLSSGNYNLAIGSSAMATNETGSNNMAFGENALSGGNAFNNCIGIGANSLNGNSADYNIGIGGYTLRGANSSNNVAIGYNAGSFNSGGSYCSFLGDNANCGEFSTCDFAYSTAIGSNTLIDDNHQIRLGTTNEYVKIDGNLVCGNINSSGIMNTSSLGIIMTDNTAYNWGISSGNIMRFNCDKFVFYNYAGTQNYFGWDTNLFSVNKSASINNDLSIGGTLTLTSQFPSTISMAGVNALQVFNNGIGNIDTLQYTNRVYWYNQNNNDVMMLLNGAQTNTLNNYGLSVKGDVDCNTLTAKAFTFNTYNTKTSSQLGYVYKNTVSGLIFTTSGPATNDIHFINSLNLPAGVYSAFGNFSIQPQSGSVNITYLQVYFTTSSIGNKTVGMACSSFPVQTMVAGNDYTTMYCSISDTFTLTSTTLINFYLNLSFTGSPTVQGNSGAVFKAFRIA